MTIPEPPEPLGTLALVVLGYCAIYAIWMTGKAIRRKK